MNKEDLIKRLQSVSKELDNFIVPNKCANEQSLKDKIIKNLKNNKNSIIFEDIPSDTKIENCSIIQSFFGTDIERIESSITAIKYLLKSSPMPYDWIFVECQYDKNDAVFSFLRNYGINYIFVKRWKNSDGLFIKQTLWNLGVKHAKTDKFVFLDSDVAFSNSDWLLNVSRKLETYDLISPQGWSYYSNDETNYNLLESIGHSIENDPTDMSGHIGFGISMTRKTFDIIGEFKPSSFKHEDNYFWMKICGSRLRHPVLGWSPYRYAKENGFDLKVGSTENIMFHVFHGNISDRKYPSNSYVTWFCVQNPFSEIEFDKFHLPIWSKTPIGRIMSRISVRFNKTNEDLLKIINDEYKYEYGQITEDDTLIFALFFVPSFENTTKKVLEVFNNIKQNCEEKFNFICFVDCRDGRFEEISKYLAESSNGDVKCVVFDKDFKLNKYIKLNGSVTIVNIPITFNSKKTFFIPKCKPSEEISLEFLMDGCFDGLFAKGIKK